MKLDHLGKEQLTYLEGMVEKCAAAGIDPQVIMKMAASTPWEDIKGGAGEAAGGAWKDIYGGGKELVKNKLESIDYGGLVPWAAGAGDVGDPADVAANTQYAKHIKQMRQFADKPNASPLETALGAHYRNMMSNPDVVAAGRPTPVTGGERMSRGFAKLNPLNWGRSTRANLEAGWGQADSRRANAAQYAAIQKWQAANKFKAPAPSQAYAKPMAIPGLQYTAYNEPYNFGARYNAA